MILSDTAIRNMCLNVEAVTPFDPDMVNPASLDVRLGDNILIESASSTELVPLNLAEFGWCEESPYELVPGQFILAETLETVKMPLDIGAQLALKSTRARQGLEHLMAGYIDPGFCGRITLELHNSRQLHPVAIWPGMRIAQLVFHRLTQAPKRSYAVTGRYQNSTKVTAAII